ncbi:MAG: hypothetical protein JWP37_3461 [Mucilaginibacter sp.]|nr:hypothetical protein [Mucilaginibacter sp.]
MYNNLHFCEFKFTIKLYLNFVLLSLRLAP